MTYEIPRDGVLHKHPYSTLPLLESHLHPKFAIYDAGRKLYRSAEALDFSFGTIQTLYGVWTKFPPEKSKKDSSYIGSTEEESVSSDNNDDSNDDSYKGRTGQTDQAVNEQRPRTRSDAATERDRRPRTRSATKRDGAGSGSAVVQSRTLKKRVQKRVQRKLVEKKRKVLTDLLAHNHQLSEATVSRLNQGHGWTDDRIRRWSSNLSKRKDMWLSNVVNRYLLI